MSESECCQLERIMSVDDEDGEVNGWLEAKDQATEDPRKGGWWYRAAKV